MAPVSSKEFLDMIKTYSQTVLQDIKFMIGELFVNIQVEYFSALAVWCIKLLEFWNKGLTINSEIRKLGN